MGQVSGRGRFSTLHSSETPGPIFMKLEIFNYFPDTTLQAKFQGATSTWVVWANSQFEARKFLSFSPSFITPTGHIFGHIPTHNTVIIRRSRQGSAFCGLERWNLKFDPLYHQKNVKIKTFSWRSKENCNRHNSGTVSRIHLKLGTGIEHPSGITWRDSKVEVRGQGHKVT